MNPENTGFEYGTTTDIIQYLVFPSKRTDKYYTSLHFISIMKKFHQPINRLKNSLNGQSLLIIQSITLFNFFIFYIMSTNTQKIHFSIRDKEKNIQKSEIIFEYKGGMPKEEIKKAVLLHFCIQTLTPENRLIFCGDLIKNPQEAIEEFIAHTEKFVKIVEIED